MDDRILTAREFDLSGGRLCLDFANTVGGQRDTQPRERLSGYADLVAWTFQSRIVNELEARQLLAKAERRPADAAAVFARSIALREAIYHIFAAVAASHPLDSADLDTLQAELSVSIARSRLVPGHTGFAWVWTGGEDALDRMLWPVARSTVDLLTSEDLRQVRECASSTCSWLFLDTTRNRSRQWCDMRSCGNREKARRHYERHRAARSGSNRQKAAAPV